ncbi:MAG: sulfurtransferase TusA family protein [Alcaligenaceae bacterium]|jgi:tRNA 2-thiouridine synthesizing protein A|nr:sulfurtransferase TusA family protein [Alcaligenaceae bacterium]
MAEVVFDQVVEAKNLLCPLPILRAKKALSSMESGQVLKVITTDPKAMGDFQAFCTQSKNELIVQKDNGDSVEHYIKRR